MLHTETWENYTDVCTLFAVNTHLMRKLTCQQPTSAQRLTTISDLESEFWPEWRHQSDSMSEPRERRIDEPEHGNERDQIERDIGDDLHRA